MKAEHYRFKIGNVECASVSDGSFDYPLEMLFANVERAEVEQALRKNGQPTEQITTPYTFLFVQTESQKILVDMGAGPLGPDTGKLLPNLSAIGITPSMIDTVIITHAHPDHVGGTLNSEGELVFDNARYFITNREWNFWFSNEAPAMAPERHVAIARKNLEPLLKRIHLVDPPYAILPGIRMLAAYGHTPGHVAVEVESRGQKLVYIADTVLHPLHIAHPTWLPVFDVLPDEADASKRRIFDAAAKEESLLLGMHFAPPPSLGHVIPSGDGWQWRPRDLL